MEAFFLVIIIGLLIAILVGSSSYRSMMKGKINQLDKKVNYLIKELRKLHTEGNYPNDKSTQKTPYREEKPVKKVVPEKPKTIEEEKIIPTHTLTPKQTAEEIQPPTSTKEEALEKELEELEKKQDNKPIEKEVIQNTATITKKPQLEGSKSQNNTFEQQVGENWLNKIGIVILVLGIGYSVKYAIDKHWIDEIGRVLLGIGSGGVLLAIAYFLRKSYRAFSSVLAGGAFATFYYTITIAYQYYGMFNQTTAFGIMVGITLLSSLLALKFNRVELAAISLVGGFTSPFMVAGETNNYTSFFTYLAILNIGMLFMSYFKKWQLIKLLSILFTAVLFFSFVLMEIVFLDSYKKDENLIPTSFLFVTLYYIIFYTAITIYTLRKKEKFNGWELTSFITISFVYLTCGLLTLYPLENGNWQGIFTISLATLNLLIALVFKGNKNIDINLYHTLIAKVITLVTLFALIQLDGYSTTAFWAIESTLLIWLAQKTKIKLFKHLSFGVFMLSLFGIMLSWAFYSYTNQVPFINTGFITFLITVAAFIVSTLLLSRDKTSDFYFFVNASSYRYILKFWIGFSAYIYLLLELNFLCEHYTDYKTAHWVQIQMNFGYHILVAIVVLLWNRKSKNDLVKTFILVGLSLFMILYLTAGNYSLIYLRNASIVKSTEGVWYNMHYVSSIFFVGCFILYNRFFVSPYPKEKGFHNFFYVVASIGVLWLLSVELDHAAVKLYSTNRGSIPELNLQINNIIDITHKAGYTVLWGLFSFVLMFIGMRKNLQAIRLIALILFLVTIVKLLVFDLYNISELGRIIAFIALGILLLVVSFMYQRLKKLIVKGE